MLKHAVGFFSILVAFALGACATPIAISLPATITPYIITATPGPTQTARVVTVTQTRPAAQPATNATATLVPTYTPTTIPTATPTFVAASPTATNSPTVAGTASPTPCPILHSAPSPFDPPLGKIFSAKSMVLRWNPDQDLRGDESFEVRVWPENGIPQASIGTTRNNSLSVDFMTWKYSGTVGKFFWTIVTKRAEGCFTSSISQPFWFFLTSTEPYPGP